MCGVWGESEEGRKRERERERERKRERNFTCTLVVSVNILKMCTFFLVFIMPCYVLDYIHLMWVWPG